jgi:hypothetical protein
MEQIGGFFASAGGLAWIEERQTVSKNSESCSSGQDKGRIGHQSGAWGAR